MSQILDLQHYHLLKTDLGFVGIAWNRQGISSLQLPETSKEKTRATLLQGLAKRGLGAEEASRELPSFVKELIKKIPAHLEGRAQDFSEIPISTGDESPFFAKIYSFCQRRLSAGKTISYGELAKAVGRPKAARAVGIAMSRNKVPLIIPCHRVLGAQKNKRLVGFSAPGGTETKAKLLALESCQID